MKVLGIWDGHDAGAALVEDSKVLFAVNEERLTRRKLEIGFPEKSLRACLDYGRCAPGDIAHVAASTSDFAKTLTRLFPSLREEYYLIRRRKKDPGLRSQWKKRAKYRLTEFPPSPPTAYLSRRHLRRRLDNLGFRSSALHLLDHHLCHAAAAALCSPFEEGLVVTLDGLGDGLSGTVSTFQGSRLTRVAELSARHSFGIFFEHVTNLMNMRELEDEGKVMALANYAYPVDDGDNPMMKMIAVEGTSVRCAHSSLDLYRELGKILWRYPSEQFAYMAQRTLTVKVTELVRNALGKTGMENLCLAGGVFSNVKLNRDLRLLPEVRGWYVFPHMGDGGLALGAAIEVNRRVRGEGNMVLTDIALGPEYGPEAVEAALAAGSFSYRKVEDISDEVANLLAGGEIVLWFQGKMELGPRALGRRSILARPDSEAVREALNMKLKKRVWYQPFCPSILEEDAPDLLADYDGRPDSFMTMAYSVREEKRGQLRGVINVDGSCRPQILGVENRPYRRLIEHFKARTGIGAVLNTSFNVHGDPMVCSPEDALSTLGKTGCSYLAIGDYLVTPKGN